jgi:hypothetical protein
MNTQTSCPILDLPALFDLPLFRVPMLVGRRVGAGEQMPCPRQADFLPNAVVITRTRDEDAERWDGLS